MKRRHPRRSFFMAVIAACLIKRDPFQLICEPIHGSSLTNHAALCKTDLPGALFQAIASESVHVLPLSVSPVLPFPAGTFTAQQFSQLIFTDPLNDSARIGETPARVRGRGLGQHVLTTTAAQKAGHLVDHERAPQPCKDSKANDT
jgi:hypothetical protein